MQEKYTNLLIKESSPYLLQHAHNPVNWLAWSEESLDIAKKENKLVLVSIGYSSCHWCHVMERESFENKKIADVMNENFICIKVDREERPDIDKVYMDAVQLMTGSGGWPLNCFILPDGRPVYGGTYYPPESWEKLLVQLAGLWKNEPEKVKDYAEKLTEGVKNYELIKKEEKPAEFTFETIKTGLRKWSKKFDLIEGGPNYAPKFPMPVNYLFLLRYYYHTKDEKILSYLKTTLKKIAYGGIYDHIGGGFARYSTDMMWKVPHFEKMLYDNAQLVSLYSNGFQLFKEPLYEEVVSETLNFTEREMTSPEGGFYSAIDADSEGVEGKFYVWGKEELKKVLGEKYDMAAEYFNFNQHGLWEGDYIPLRRKDNKEIAAKFNVPPSQLEEEVRQIKGILFKEREKRKKPFKDEKSLASWNGLMLSAYISAWNAFQKEDYLIAAIKNARFIKKNFIRDDFSLYHTWKDGKPSVEGFLEDYAMVADAFISLYEATFDIQWLYDAKSLCDYATEKFYDAESGMYFFTSSAEKPLIARKMEVADNVIPASNSVMAEVLFRLSKFYNNHSYEEKASLMLNNVQDFVQNHCSYYANWARLMFNFIAPFHEVVIAGDEAMKKNEEINRIYLPNKILAGGKKEEKLPLLKNRFTHKETTIFVCSGFKCNFPVKEIKDVLKQIKVEVKA
jgi:uncharacterized protein